jgi:threonine dehydrogenase-like Zn-dependent dehydrogenase
MLCLAGTFISSGLVGKVEVTHTMGHFIDRGITMVGSANYKAWTMPRVLDFMARNIDKYPLDKIISDKFKLEDAEKAMKLAAEGKVVRAGIVMD